MDHGVEVVGQVDVVVVELDEDLAAGHGAERVALRAELRVVALVDVRHAVVVEERPELGGLDARAVGAPRALLPGPAAAEAVVVHPRAPGPREAARVVARLQHDELLVGPALAFEALVEGPVRPAPVRGRRHQDGHEEGQAPQLRDVAPRQRRHVEPEVARRRRRDVHVARVGPRSPRRARLVEDLLGDGRRRRAERARVAAAAHVERVHARGLVRAARDEELGRHPALADAVVAGDQHAEPALRRPVLLVRAAHVHLSDDLVGPDFADLGRVERALAPAQRAFAADALHPFVARQRRRRPPLRIEGDAVLVHRRRLMGCHHERQLFRMSRLDSKTPRPQPAGSRAPPQDRETYREDREPAPWSCELRLTLLYYSDIHVTPVGAAHLGTM